MLDVSAAVFLRNQKILAFRRKPGISMAGCWEYPGGKIETGESPGDCLRREIREELGVQITVGEYLGANVYGKGASKINLHAFIVTAWSGDMKLTDHDKMVWLADSELDSIQWCPADLHFVDLIRNLDHL